mmetsp:Transcript_18564/g.43444  ORF Transcript_18564/g.43444 Transcript_18564/m.43444 type:complete len:110 (-) Transcript_18564:317-646(-)
MVVRTSSKSTIFGGKGELDAGKVVKMRASCCFTELEIPVDKGKVDRRVEPGALSPPAACLEFSDHVGDGCIAGCVLLSICPWIVAISADSVSAICEAGEGQLRDAGEDS